MGRGAACWRSAMPAGDRASSTPRSRPMAGSMSPPTKGSCSATTSRTSGSAPWASSASTRSRCRAMPVTPSLAPVLAQPFVAQHGEQHVVLPAPVDAEILAGVAFLAEAGLEQQPAARPVMRQAGRLDAVQLQALEGKAQHQAEAGGHVSPPGIALADPISEARGLGDAAADVAQAEPADQRAVVAAEQEEAVALVGAPVRHIALEATAKGGARQRIGRPARLPRHEETARLAAQLRPFLPIAALGRPQRDAIVDEAERRQGGGEEPRQAEQVRGHGAVALA